jgi:hypothetical protein
MPITRYATHLKLRREYGSYMELLETGFNAATLEQVMCRNLVSVGWEGSIYCYACTAGAGSSCGGALVS